jgi:hypothetical protein
MSSEHAYAVVCRSAHRICLGQCSNGVGQLDDSDYVYVGFLGDGGAECVWVRFVCSGVGIETSTASEVVNILPSSL